jgi:CubicO group peptidase (beta-lactamase class C family)
MLASLAATYVQDGTLRWTTTVGEVLGGDVRGMHEALAGATLAQLLAHRSGLPSFDTGGELRGVRMEGDTPSAQRLAFARQVLRGAPAYPVGSKTVYSNAGYVVAGVLLERVGGQPFEQLMMERLFRPLGMQAHFGSPVPPEAGQPWGHYEARGDLTAYDDPDPVIPPFLQPAGDVSLTLADYGRYLREHLCGVQGAPTRLLSPALVRALHEPQGSDPTTAAGMGWGRSELGGLPSSVHVGGTGTFSAFVVIQPGRDRAVATVTNAGDARARAAALELLRTLTSGDVK